MTPFDDIMSWSINKTFYLTCVTIDMNKMKEMQIEQWRRSH